MSDHVFQLVTLLMNIAVFLAVIRLFTIASRLRNVLEEVRGIRELLSKERR